MTSACPWLMSHNNSARGHCFRHNYFSVSLNFHRSQRNDSTVSHSTVKQDAKKCLWVKTKPKFPLITVSQAYFIVKYSHTIELENGHAQKISNFSSFFHKSHTNLENKLCTNIVVSIKEKTYQVKTHSLQQKYSKIGFVFVFSIRPTTIFSVS